MSEAALPPLPLRVLLGSDLKQRLRLQRSLLAGAVCTVAIGVIWYCVEAGFASPVAAYWVIAYLVAGMAALFVALRSGWNLRFAEPSLTLLQMAFAVPGMTAAYAVTGPARGGFLVLLACAMVFGAFSVQRRLMLAACGATLVLLALVCAAMPWLDPARYDGRVEAIHFILCLIGLPVVSSIAGSLATTRAKWRAQRQELADALERIRVLATRDELTGLVNRRHMQELIEHELVRVRRSGRAACIAMVDIDYFKSVNDRFGHAGGDAVLKAFAQAAVTTARRSDVVARWGGEEFLWLLPDTIAPDAELALARLRTRLSTGACWTEREELRVTFSAGLTELRAGETLDEAVERADSALYQAKSRGRDRVAVQV